MCEHTGRKGKHSRHKGVWETREALGIQEGRSLNTQTVGKIDYVTLLPENVVTRKS